MMRKVVRTTVMIALLPLTLVGCAAKRADQQPAAQPQASLPANVSAAIQTDHAPARLIITKDAIYVDNHRGGTLQRIDPSTNRIVSTLRVGGQLVLDDTAVAGDLAWVCTNVDGVLHQVDLASPSVRVEVPAKCDGGSRSIIEGLLWASPGPDTDGLLILDALSGAEKAKIPVDTSVWWGPALRDGQTVMVPNAKGILRCSLDATACTAESGDASWLFPTGGKLYRLPDDGALAELDPHSLATVKTYQVPKHDDVDIALVADDSGHLYYRPNWVDVYRITLSTGVVEKFLQTPWEEVNTGMAWAFGSLWITNFTADTVWRVSTAH
jgi:hypothetical protein